MRVLSKVEQRRLSELHPDLQLISERSRAKQDFFYVCGGRDEVAQEYAFAIGTSKVHFPNSKHNKSKNPAYKSDAVDVAPFVNGKIEWKDTTTFYKIYKAFQESAAELGIKIRSGVDFDMDGNLKNDRWRDLPHHELI